MQKAFLPSDLSDAERRYLVDKIKEAARRISVKGEGCFMCDEDSIEFLDKHHLIPKSKYADREDINDHITPLCKNHHNLVHDIIYEGKTITKYTRDKMIANGQWVRMVEVDRMAAKALIGVPYR